MIKRENLERFLERGETLGFIKETNNQAFLGWILLSKQKLPERHLELITANEETQVVKKQDKINRIFYSNKTTNMYKNYQ